MSLSLQKRALSRVDCLLYPTPQLAFPSHASPALRCTRLTSLESPTYVPLATADADVPSPLSPCPPRRDASLPPFNPPVTNLEALGAQGYTPRRRTLGYRRPEVPASRCSTSVHARMWRKPSTARAPPGSSAPVGDSLSEVGNWQCDRGRRRRCRPPALWPRAQAAATTP